MSIEAINHILRTDISDGVAKLVAIVLADYADPCSGLAYPKIETLARKCSQSVRTVQRKIRVLEELGVLRVEPWMEGGRQKANRYILYLPGVPRPGRGDRIDGAAPRGATVTPQVRAEGCPSVTGMGDSVGTPGVTLLSPQETPPRESLKEVTPQPPGGGRNASRIHDRGKGAERPAPPIRRPRGGDPPALDAATGARFARLWSAYPEAGRIDCDRAEAERVFSALTPADQNLAVTAAAGYAAHVARHAARSKALHGWLRQRRFVNLVALPLAEAAHSARIFVRDGSPEWEAWDAHDRATGRVPRTPTWSESKRAMGWWFASAMPPSAVAAE